MKEEQKELNDGASLEMAPIKFNFDEFDEYESEILAFIPVKKETTWYYILFSTSKVFVFNEKMIVKYSLKLSSIVAVMHQDYDQGFLFAQYHADEDN